MRRSDINAMHFITAILSFVIAILAFTSINVNGFKEMNSMDNDATEKSIHNFLFPLGYDTPLNKKFSGGKKARKYMQSNEIRKSFKEKNSYSNGEIREIGIDAAQTFLTTCAWPLEVSKSAVNLLYNDLNVVYHAVVLTGISENRYYKISGKIPKARYFSFSSYDVSTGIPIDSIVDYQMNSDSDNDETFEFYVTMNGDMGFPNELRGFPIDSSKCGSGSNKDNKSCPVSIVYRLYLPDNVDELGKNKYSNIAYGSVAPPTITYIKDVKEGRKKPMGVYERELKQCNAFVQTHMSDMFDYSLQSYEENIDGTFNLAKDGQCPPLENDNFILYQPQNQQEVVEYANYDATYMFNCLTPGTYVELNGTLNYNFTDPYTFEPDENLNARYISFQTGSAGGQQKQTYDNIYDQEIVDFYTSGTTDSWNGEYRIVVGASPTEAESLGFYDPDTMLFLYSVKTETKVSHYEFSKHDKNKGEAVLFIRELLSPFQIDGTVDYSIAYTYDTCSTYYSTLSNPESKSTVCNSEFVKNTMQQRYVSMTILR